MTFELLFGIGLIAIGAFSSGSFSIPFGKTRNWAWENYWLIYSLFAYVIVPLVACYVFCPLFPFYNHCKPCKPRQYVYP